MRDVEELKKKNARRILGEIFKTKILRNSWKVAVRISGGVLYESHGH